MRSTRITHEDISFFLSALKRNADTNGVLTKHLQDIAKTIGISENLITTLSAMSLYEGRGKQFKKLKFSEVNTELVDSVFENYKKLYTSKKVKEISISESNDCEIMFQILTKLEAIENKLNYINDVTISLEEYLS